MKKRKDAIKEHINRTLGCLRLLSSTSVYDPDRKNYVLEHASNGYTMIHWAVRRSKYEEARALVDLRVLYKMRSYVDQPSGYKNRSALGWSLFSGCFKLRICFSKPVPNSHKKMKKATPRSPWHSHCRCVRSTWRESSSQGSDVRLDQAD